jgi:putrescine---pyruvate transaminase
VLLVCDSVICGFGRLGTWLAFERFGIEPDLVTFAKGVTSGYLPLGGVIVSGAVAEPFWSEPGRVTVRHGQTYSGHAAVCAAALANLDIMEREGLVERGRELEEELHSTLLPLADHPLVEEVRGGTGMLVGVALANDAVASDPALPAKAYRSIRPHGVILRALGSSLAVSPPLTISSAEIQLIHDAVRAGLDALVASSVRAA